MKEKQINHPLKAMSQPLEDHKKEPKEIKLKVKSFT